jgi:hypothetical protein
MRVTLTSKEVGIQDQATKKKVIATTDNFIDTWQI